MPNFYGEDIATVEQITSAFRRHGDAARSAYRARYVYDGRSRDLYSSTTLERPASMLGNPPGRTFPWEQIFVAAADCAGSDYPMLASHLGVPIERVEFLVEGVFDPRGEFDGLAGFEAPADAARCYLSLHVRARLTSRAPRQALEAIHERVIARNMVLGALRGIPLTHELEIERQEAIVPPARDVTPARDGSDLANRRVRNDVT